MSSTVLVHHCRMSEYRAPHSAQAQRAPLCHAVAMVHHAPLHSHWSVSLALTAAPSPLTRNTRVRTPGRSTPLRSPSAPCWRTPTPAWAPHCRSTHCCDPTSWTGTDWEPSVHQGAPRYVPTTVHIHTKALWYDRPGAVHGDCTLDCVEHLRGISIGLLALEVAWYWRMNVCVRVRLCVCAGG